MIDHSQRRPGVASCRCHAGRHLPRSGDGRPHRRRHPSVVAVTLDEPLPAGFPDSACSLGGGVVPDASEGDGPLNSGAHAGWAGVIAVERRSQLGLDRLLCLEHPSTVTKQHPQLAQPTEPTSPAADASERSLGGACRSGRTRRSGRLCGPLPGSAPGLKLRLSVRPRTPSSRR